MSIPLILTGRKSQVLTNNQCWREVANAMMCCWILEPRLNSWKYNFGEASSESECSATEHHCIFKFTRSNLHGMIIKQQVKIDTSQIEAIEAHRGLSREIVKYKTFPLWIHKIIFSKPKWYDSCGGTYIPYIFKIFPQFFLVTHYLLSKPPYVCFLWCGLVYPWVYWFLCSRSLALWHCGPGCLLLLCTCCCLSAFRSLFCSLDLPWFWIPGSPGWLELWNSML